MSTASPARRALLCAFFALLVAVPLAHAQKKRAKPLRIVVVGPAGGTADIAARLLADGLTKELSQPVVVEPKAGAAGTIAVNDLLKAPRDGTTLLVGVNSLVSEIPHVIKPKFDAARELRPLAEIGRGGRVLVSAPTLPARDLAELIAWVKANPGKVDYASYSPGTLSHVMGLQLNRAAGIDMTHVGYRGSTPALADVMGSHVPLMFDGMPTALPLIKAGKVKAFAISTPVRSTLLPNVPTFTELGYPQLEALAWIGLWTTPDVPAATQSRLREAALRVLAQSSVRERLQEIGFDAGQPRTPDEMTKALRADYERVEALLRSIGFRPE